MRARAGFALPFSLVLTGITLVVVGAGAAHHVTMARLTREYLSRTRCRLAAQSAIEATKLQVKYAVDNYTGGSSEGVIDAVGSHVASSVNGLLNGLDYVASTNIDGCAVRISCGEATDINDGANASVPIYATATLSAGGRTTSVTLQECVCFNTTQSHVFDYAYFANNQGHLEGSKIQINGDVRSNGNFLLDAALVNGYVYASGAITLKNTPKIWAAGKYNTEIHDDAAYDNDKYAPVRPTNPPDASTGIAEWKGGFEAPDAVTTTTTTTVPTGGGLLGALRRFFGGGGGGTTTTTTTSTMDELTIKKGETFSAAGAPIVNEKIAELYMPQIDDLEKYKNYAATKRVQCYRLRTDGSYQSWTQIGGSLVCTNCDQYYKSDTDKDKYRIGVEYEVWQPKYRTKDIYEYKVATKYFLGFPTDYEWVRDPGNKVYFDKRKIGSEQVEDGKEEKTVTRYLRSVVVKGGHTIDNANTKYSDMAGTDTKFLRPFEVEAPLHEGGIYGKSDVRAAEEGSVVLIGTWDCPIEIHGPVVFERDVIIKGFVTGQGTIYAGRNIHVIGDIVYVDPPTWPHPDKVADVQQRRERNAKKDLLALICKGSIVVGNYNTDDWNSYVKKYVQGGYTRTSGAAYGNYYVQDSDTVAAGGKKATFVDASSTKNFLGQTSYNDGTFGATTTFKKYETVLGDKALDSFSQDYELDLFLGLPDSFLFRLARISRLLNQYFVYRAKQFFKDRWSYSRQYNFWSGFRDWLKSNKNLYDAQDITRIDAVLYSSHGIFGLAGGEKTGCTINGAVIGQDECIFPYTKDRWYSRWTSSSVRSVINWDMRLKADAAERCSSMGLPLGISDPCTLSWQEVPDDFNK